MSFAAVNFYGVGRVQFYRISGILVASEIDLPGLIPGAPGRAPQVTIRLGEVPDSLPQPTASGPTWQIAGKQFLLRIPKVARFLLRDGREITFEAEPGADAGDIPLYLLGTAYGILLHQRRQIVLHGSAVRVGDKAVLFCGPSGAEKSTMAAALVQRAAFHWYRKMSVWSRRPIPARRPSIPTGAS